MAISLSSGVRQSLQSLQSTAQSAQTAQGRLASGKRVNSAIDNAVNFFTSSNLNTRADSFSSLLDGMSNSIQTIKAASTGIDGITKLVKSLQSTVKQAQSDSLASKPSNTSATAIGTTPATSQDDALNKTLVTDIGLTANQGVTLKAGNSTYNINIGSTDTLRDLVANINKSGIASASVDQNGKLTIAGTSSEDLYIGVGTAGADNAKLGVGTVDAKFNSADSANNAKKLTASATSAVRSNLVSQFNDVRSQIDQLAKDAGFNGTNLLAGDKLKTVFNEKTGSSQSKQEVQGTKLTADNLGIQEAKSSGGTNFQSDTDLSSAADALTNALSSLTTLSSSLGASLSVVQARQDFSKSLIDTLKAGADNLVNADTNEEGANLLALQTRQSLSQTALSLSSQADQAVLKLF